MEKRIEIWKKYASLENNLVGKVAGKPVFFFLQPNQYLKNSKPFSEQEKQIAIDPSLMPIIRDIVAVGKTPSQLAEEMTNKLKEYVQNPVVAISLKEVNSSNIFVLGEVAHPGKFPLKSKTTLLQGITVAGGFTPIAARNQIVIFRFTETAPGMKRLTASYDEIVLRSSINENFELKSGDTVVVPSEAMVVFPGR